MPSGTVQSGTDQTKATASLVIVLVSRIQISIPGENNFVKWKGEETADFLHMKGIKSFGYEIVIEKESEKISKFSKKIIWKPF